jgi:hypothetical protein
MKLAPWSSQMPNKKIFYILCNLKVHCQLYKRQSPVLILNQMNPVHVPTLRFIKTHFDTILPSMPRSFKWSFSFRFPHYNPAFTSLLSHVHHNTPISSSLIHYPPNFLWGVQIKMLFTKSFSTAPCYFLPLGFTCFPQHPQPMLFA